MELSSCTASCSGGRCELSKTLNTGTQCYACIDIAEEQCRSGTMELATCEDSCEENDEGICMPDYTRNDGTKCYRCEEKISDAMQCPSGTVPDKSTCDAQCDGTCSADNNGCYSCTVLQCPGGTTQNTCPSSCTNGCDIATQEGDTVCYRCKQSCEEVCTAQGYARVGIDWSDYLQSYLAEYSCVSGASIGISQATIGSCTCSNAPSVNIDTTPSVCRGTPCGDVQCGTSVSCPVEDGTLTATCTWNGWKKIDVNQFQPVMGQ